jgi:hypothetical protein
MNSKCEICVRILWEIDRDLELTHAQLQEAASRMLREEMNDPDLQIDEQLLDLHEKFINDYDSKGRVQAIGRILQAFEDKTLPLSPPPGVKNVSEYIRENYELVFLDLAPGKAPDTKNMLTRFGSWSSDQVL